MALNETQEVWPPCPLAPHHMRAVATADTVNLRVLFATEPAREHRVRSLIGEALATGRLTGPDDRTTTWSLWSSTPDQVRPDEAEHAAQLIANP